jgi:hypothetical protein
MVRSALFALLFPALFSLAAVPPLDGFFPAGAARGTTNLITAVGKFEQWPPQVWTDGDGMTFVAETNKGKFQVTIEAEAKPGPRLVRLYNEQGVSEPRIFVVGASREAIEVEPNNHFAKPQSVSELPATLNGKFDKGGDVDSFAMDLRAGQWLEARIDCYTLMSKADAVLRLMTTNGLQLAWNHDFTSLDPRLVWHATNDQKVVLQIFGFAYPPGSDVSLTGGESTAYRLHASVTNAVPFVCERSTESEPNNKAGEATELELPSMVVGRINDAGDEDRFQFIAQKGQSIELKIEAASFGSPLDAWLRLEDTNGNTLTRSDDADGSPDPRLEWKVTGTNTHFIVAVGSVTHRGGTDYCYRLSAQRVEPDFQVTLGGSSLVLTPGATNELKLDVKRLRGFTNRLAVAVQGLPEGVTLLTTNLPEKEPLLKFVTSAEAVKFQGPIQVAVRDVITSQEKTAPFELTTRGETAYTRLLVEKSDDLWLTILPPKPDKNAAPESK